MEYLSSKSEVGSALVETALTLALIAMATVASVSFAGETASVSLCEVAFTIEHGGDLTEIARFENEANECGASPGDG